MVVHPTVHEELVRARRAELEQLAARTAPATGGRRRTVRAWAAARIRPLAFRLSGIPAPVAGTGTC